MHSFRRQLLVPDPAQVMQGGLARAVGPPAGIGVDRCIAGDIQHDRAASLASRGGQPAQQRFREAKRAHQIRGQRPLQVLTFGIPQKRQLRRPEIRGIVDQYVEAAQFPPRSAGRGDGCPP